VSDRARRLVLGEASPRRSYETLARRKQAIRTVRDISAFYRIIRTMPESQALCRNNLAANVALCHWSPRGTHLFIRQRRDRSSAPAQSDRPHPESEAIACRGQHFKRKVRPGYQYLIDVFTFKEVITCKVLLFLIEIFGGAYGWLRVCRSGPAITSGPSRGDVGRMESS
jgi:hypothetical protein